MTTFQAWELSRPFPTLGSRLCPTAKLVFHVGIAFVKCERVNNTISRAPESSENNQQPGSCQPKGKNYQLYLKILPMALVPGVFVHYKPACSFRKQGLGTAERGSLHFYESRTSRWFGEWTGHAESIISFPLKLQFSWGRGRQGAHIYRRRF